MYGFDVPLLGSRKNDRIWTQFRIFCMFLLLVNYDDSWKTWKRDPLINGSKWRKVSSQEFENDRLEEGSWERCDCESVGTDNFWRLFPRRHNRTMNTIKSSEWRHLTTSLVCGWGMGRENDRECRKICQLLYFRWLRKTSRNIAELHSTVLRSIAQAATRSSLTVTVNGHSKCYPCIASTRGTMTRCINESEDLCCSTIQRSSQHVEIETVISAELW